MLIDFVHSLREKVLEFNTNSNRRMCWINAVYKPQSLLLQYTAHIVLNTYYSKSSLVFAKEEKIVLVVKLLWLLQVRVLQVCFD